MKSSSIVLNAPSWFAPRQWWRKGLESRYHFSELLVRWTCPCRSLVIYINVVVFTLLVQDSHFRSMIDLRTVLKQTCPSEKVLSHLLMNRAINMFVTLSTKLVTRGFGLNVRRRLDWVQHVRCTYDTDSQSVRTCVVGWEKLRHLATVRLTYNDRVVAENRFRNEIQIGPMQQVMKWQIKIKMV